MSERVDFNITNKGISVGASVTRDYFEERVLPLITSLLADMSPAQKRRFAASRPVKPGHKAKPASVHAPKVPEYLPALSTVVTPAAAISSYRPKPAQQSSGTTILA